MKEKEWMKIAIQEAEMAFAEGEMPVGCVIIRGEEMIARGHNLREQTGDPTAHAEIVAMRNAARKMGTWRLDGCELFVTLEPCPMCAGAISQARIDRVMYGAADERYGCAGSVYRIPEDPVFNHFCPCDGGVMAGECRSMIDRFFAQRRR